MLWTMVVTKGLWLLGFIGHVGGSLIHTLPGQRQRRLEVYLCRTVFNLAVSRIRQPLRVDDGTTSKVPRCDEHTSRKEKPWAQFC
jgi:hypothetical protein